MVTEITGHMMINGVLKLNKKSNRVQQRAPKQQETVDEQPFQEEPVMQEQQNEPQVQESIEDLASIAKAVRNEKRNKKFPDQEQYQETQK